MACLFLGAITAAAQPLTPEELIRLTDSRAADSYSLLRDILSLPNDAHYPGHVEQNVAWMTSAFQARDFKMTVLETDAAPLLLAERGAPAQGPTVLIYLQIDGQPVDTSAWNQESPYRPVLKERDGDRWSSVPWSRLDETVDPEWRVFARSASDAKGPAAMFLSALDAFDGAELRQGFHIKVVMDFEEELGSPHLPAAVERNREALAADMLIIFDGPRHVSNVPSLTFGARGIATITLTVFGPRVAQHSGHWGNYVPNPALRLSQLVGSMKGVDGRVTLPGFYDGVTLDESTQRILAGVPDDEPAIREAMGIATADAVAPTYQESIQYPSLNLRGMASGWVGSASRTIIPPTATAEIDVRLVPEIEADRLLTLVQNHIVEQGFHIISGEEPTDEERAAHDRLIRYETTVSYQAFRTPFESRVGLWLDRALTRAFGREPVKKRMSGGSIPISPFITTLGVPAVIVPTVNADNNQHSPNENLRIGNYLDGIRTFLAILTEPLN